MNPSYKIDEPLEVGVDDEDETRTNLGRARGGGEGTLRRIWRDITSSTTWRGRERTPALKRNLGWNEWNVKMIQGKGKPGFGGSESADVKKY